MGAALALELGRLGVTCILIEQTDGTVEQPKLGLVSTRSMEYARRWGVAQEIRDVYPPDYPATQLFVTSLCGYELARQDYPTFSELPPLDCSPERHQRCSQIFLEPILRRAADRHASVSVKYLTRLEGFDHAPDGITARCRHTETGEDIVIEADYLVGCDGAGSLVRQTLGIEMSGKLLSHSVNIFFRSPELWTRHDKGKAERYMLIHPNGTWGNFTAIDGRELWRLSIAGNQDPVDMEAFDPDRALRIGFGADDIDYEIISTMAWTRLQLVADSFGRDRVWLAGDSAHCFSPTGGFGGNTGVGDAVNLAWKLAATIEGWGGAGLVASYEAERRPVAFRNTGEAAKNFQRLVSAGDNPDLLDDTPEGQVTRDRVGEAVRGETQKEWEVLGMQLGYRYEASPIIVEDGTEPTPDDSQVYVPTARPGHRAPHFWLSDGQSSLDLFGDGFALFRFDADSDAGPIMAAAEAAGAPLTLTDINDPDARELYQYSLAIVRPDGHVAWRGDAAPEDCAELFAVICGRSPI